MSGIQTLTVQLLEILFFSYLATWLFDAEAMWNLCSASARSWLAPPGWTWLDPDLGTIIQRSKLLSSKWGNTNVIFSDWRFCFWSNLQEQQFKIECYNNTYFFESDVTKINVCFGLSWIDKTGAFICHIRT